MRKDMIISFDLDETLFVSPNEHAIETPIGFPFSLLYKMAII